MKRLIFVAALLLLAACGQPAPPADTVRVGVPTLPPSWGDPFRAESGPPTLTWAAIFDGLTRMDEHGAVQPALAESWSNVGGTEWRFVLREGLRFSDGTPADSAAVAASFRWLATAEGKTTVVGSRMREVESVETPDARTVVIHLKKPDAIFYKRMPAVPIVGAEAWKRLGPARFARQPVGTGPYRLIRFDERRRRAALERNPYTWREPQTAKMEIIELADEAVRQQALISGEIDVGRVGLDGMALLDARGVKVITASAMQVMSVAFVVAGRDGPLSDVRVRQALNYAVDKQAISDALFQGRAIPAGQPAARPTVGYNPAVSAYPYDPGRARRMLADAGYPHGFPLKLQVLTGNMPADALIYQAVARNLADVGVATEVRAIPYPVFLRKYATNDWEGVDGFGASIQGIPSNDLQRPLEGFSCIKKKPFFCDQALTRQLKDASTEVDPAKRTALLEQISAGYHDAAPGIFLVEQVDVFGASRRVASLTLANRTPQYDQIRFKDH